MSKSMPTLLLSPPRQQWEEVDSDCAGAVSFSDGDCLSPRHDEVSLPPEKTQVFLLRLHPDLLVLHWERHLQVKDFSRDCSNSGDSFHLHSATIQSNESLVSASTWQEWSQHSLDHKGDLDLLRGGCLLRYQHPAVGFVSAP